MMNLETISAHLDAAHLKLIEARRRLASASDNVELSRLGILVLDLNDYVEEKLRLGHAKRDIEKAEASIRDASNLYFGLTTADWMPDIEAIKPRRVALAELWHLYRSAVAARKAFGAMPADALAREVIAAHVAAHRAHVVYDLMTRFWDGRGQYQTRDHLIKTLRKAIKPPARPEPTAASKVAARNKRLRKMTAAQKIAARKRPGLTPYRD